MALTFQVHLSQLARVPNIVHSGCYYLDWGSLLFSSGKGVVQLMMPNVFQQGCADGVIQQRRSLHEIRLPKQPTSRCHHLEIASARHKRQAIITLQPGYICSMDRAVIDGLPRCALFCTPVLCIRGSARYLAGILLAGITGNGISRAIGPDMFLGQTFNGC